MPPQIPTREVFLHLAPWMQGVFYVTGGVASLIFVYGFWRRLRKYRKGRSENRFDHLWRRVARACATILSNATVRKGERFGGAAHTLILWASSSCSSEPCSSGSITTSCDTSI